MGTPNPDWRAALILGLVLLGACSSSPRGSEAPLSDLPPPTLDGKQLVAVGHDAGADLAATSSATSAIGAGPIGFAGMFDLVPWRDIVIDKGLLYQGFARGCAIDTVVGVRSFSLTIDALAYAHRERDGAVKVEYSFGFLLVDSIGGTPWVKNVVATAEGGKGEIEPVALTFGDLDALAAQAADDVAAGLRSVGAHTVHLTPHEREKRPESVLVVAFEDRLRAALLARGITLAGNAAYVVDIDAVKTGVAAATGTETYTFAADLSRAEQSVAFKRWSRSISRSGPR